MIIVDLIGHAGYIFILFGLILLAYKSKLGWIFRFIGEIIWTLIGLYLGMSSIWFWGVIFMIIDVFSFHKWNNDRNKG